MTSVRQVVLLGSSNYFLRGVSSLTPSLVNSTLDRAQRNVQPHGQIKEWKKLIPRTAIEKEVIAFGHEDLMIGTNHRGAVAGKAKRPVEDGDGHLHTHRRPQGS